MAFIWPAMLGLLFLIPLFVVIYKRLQQRRRQLAARYGSLGMLQGLPGQQFGPRRNIPPILFLLGLTILIVALARPQAVVSLPRIEGTVILAFDISGSMVADDVKPTRIEAMKAIAREFVQRQPPSVKIGVVAFSDSGFAVQVPTNDQAAILASINRIKPQRGTSIGQGILASLNTIAPGSGQLARRYSTLAPTPTPVPKGSRSSAVIVLLTDGENTGPPDPYEAAQTAMERGVRVYTVGIGSAAGTTLQVNGFTVHTQLDEAALQQIAQLTEGAYYKAESQQDLRSIYENLELELVIKPERAEITALFAAAGILALLSGGIYSLLWFGRLP